MDPDDLEKNLVEKEKMEAARQKRIEEKGVSGQVLYRFKYRTTKELLYNVINDFTKRFSIENKYPFSIDKMRDYFLIKSGYKYGIPIYTAQIDVTPFSDEEVYVEIRSFDWDPNETTEEDHQAETRYLDALIDYLSDLYGGETSMMDDEGQPTGIIPSEKLYNENIQADEEIQLHPDVKKNMDEVRGLSKAGYTINQIANIIGISRSTVKRYRNKMHIKKGSK